MVLRPWRSSISLACESVGAQKHEWFFEEAKITPIINTHKQILNTGEFIIANLQLSDMGNYTCAVDNDQGSDKITYFLYVQTPPTAPLLFVASATSTSLLLHWKVESNGRARVNSLTLNYRKEHGNLEEIILSKHLNSFELKVNKASNIQNTIISKTIFGIIKLKIRFLKSHVLCKLLVY